MAHYESDVTQFLRDLKASKPHLENEQKKGRSLLWDKVVDRELWAGFNKARVPQKAYVYQPNDKR